MKPCLTVLNTFPMPLLAHSFPNACTLRTVPIFRFTDFRRAPEFSGLRNARVGKSIPSSSGTGLSSDSQYTPLRVHAGRGDSGEAGSQVGRTIHLPDTGHGRISRLHWRRIMGGLVGDAATISHLGWEIRPPRFYMKGQPRVRRKQMQTVCRTPSPSLPMEARAGGSQPAPPCEHSQPAQALRPPVKVGEWPAWWHALIWYEATERESTGNICEMVGMTFSWHQCAGEPLGQVPSLPIVLPHRTLASQTGCLHDLCLRCVSTQFPDTCRNNC